jgi:hypothetical protein
MAGSGDSCHAERVWQNRKDRETRINLPSL